MAKLPKPVKDSRQMIDSVRTPSYLGPFLAASSLCNPCFRAIWLSFRWASVEMIDAQTQRRFDLGNWIEGNVQRDLANIEGVTLTEVQTNVFGYENYVKGKLDGELVGLPESPDIVHVLEVKSMKDDHFEKYRVYGIKKSHPKYYGQIQFYMHYRERRRGLFVVENKNTQARLHERVRYDQKTAEQLVERSEHVVTCGELPMKGPGFTAGCFNCRFCKHGEFCYADEPPVVTCRSCVYADLVGDGKWECSHKKFKNIRDEDIDAEAPTILSVERQKKACKHYERLF